MKVIKTTVDEGETSVTLDLFGDLQLDKETKQRIAEEVGQYLVEETLVAVSQRKSPVSGEGAFKALSKDYKKYKNQEVGHGDANLEFSGTMLDELTFVSTPEGIKIGVFGERAGAADGHNNLSGMSALPKRRFLPDEGQSYKTTISKEAERIVADALSSEYTKKDLKGVFEDVETKTALYRELEAIFGPMSRNELRLAVMRNEDVYQALDKLNKLDLL